jgi:hypothetical protein
MEPRSQRKRDKTEAKIALRSILGDFLANRRGMEPCWYRLVSTHNKHIPGTESPSPLPPISQVFGMNAIYSDELLLACGLLYYYGDQLRFREDQWDLLKGEFGLDDCETTQVTIGPLVGTRVRVIRLGAFVGDSEKLQAIRTKEGTFKIKRLRITPQQDEEEDEEDVEKVGENCEGASAGTATASPKPKKAVTIEIGESCNTPIFIAQTIGSQWRALPPSDDECRANLRGHQSLPPFGPSREKACRR